MKLKDKVAIITGGGTGIGLAAAELFAKEGAKIVVTGRRSGPLEEAVKIIQDAGGEAMFATHDVVSEASWDEVLAKVAEAYGRLDILVNNAGIASPGNIEETSMETYRAIIDINLDGVFIGTQKAIKIMKNSNGGTVVNVSSIEGLVGQPNLAAYNASKGGVRLLTKSAALHCANNRLNIRINSLHPGFIETSMTTTDLVDNLGEEAAMAMTAQVMSSIPMGRLGRPSEMATSLLFLASDDSSYMTGAELVIDGGYTAQ